MRQAAAGQKHSTWAMTLVSRSITLEVADSGTGPFGLP
jgi:hypothetical protein